MRNKDEKILKDRRFKSTRSCMRFNIKTGCMRLKKITNKRSWKYKDVMSKFYLFLTITKGLQVVQSCLTSLGIHLHKFKSHVPAESFDPCDFFHLFLVEDVEERAAIKNNMRDCLPCGQEFADFLGGSHNCKSW